MSVRQRKKQSQKLNGKGDVDVKKVYKKQKKKRTWPVYRSNMEAPDVDISGDNASQFQADLAEFLTYVNDPESLFYLHNDYLLHRLVECVARYRDLLTMVTRYRRLCPDEILLYEVVTSKNIATAITSFGQLHGYF